MVRSFPSPQYMSSYYAAPGCTSVLLGCRDDGKYGSFQTQAARIAAALRHRRRFGGVVADPATGSASAIAAAAMKALDLDPSITTVPPLSAQLFRYPRDRATARFA
jgi:hypothetical protein